MADEAIIRADILCIDQAAGTLATANDDYIGTTKAISFSADTAASSIATVVNIATTVSEVAMVAAHSVVSTGTTAATSSGAGTGVSYTTEIREADILTTITDTTLSRHSISDTITAGNWGSRTIGKNISQSTAASGSVCAVRGNI